MTERVSSCRRPKVARLHDVTEVEFVRVYVKLKSALDFQNESVHTEFRVGSIHWHTCVTIVIESYQLEKKRDPGNKKYRFGEY